MIDFLCTHTNVYNILLEVACFHLFMPNKVCAVQTPLSCGAHCGWPSDITLMRIESLFYYVKAAVVEI